jgi:hypothetical protein
MCAISSFRVSVASRRIGMFSSVKCRFLDCALRATLGMTHALRAEHVLHERDGHALIHHWELLINGAVEQFPCAYDILGAGHQGRGPG